MNCQELEECLPLLLYGELSPAEQAACNEHLAGCANCRAAREKLERFHQVLAQRPAAEASPALLAESRLALDEAIDTQQHGWRALWYNGLPIFRLQPTSGFALALTLIVCGFGLGWGLRPHAGRLTSGVADMNNASVANPDLENMRISGISRVASDPQTGGVKITMDAERRVILEGSLDDPKIQQVLVYAVKSYDNPGIRRDTLDALRSHADNPNFRQALLYAMRHDPNAGVRLEALEAVCNMQSSGDVHAALLEAIERDTNPGVRVAAVDALIDHTEKEGCDAPTEQALEHLASSDSNPYVRLKCANALMKLGK
ncbi:MAG: HEAT repeat domain-containing protein [Terriglobia bacterium]